jgi:hypothetical protein
VKFSLASFNVSLGLFAAFWSPVSSAAASSTAVLGAGTKHHLVSSAWFHNLPFLQVFSFNVEGQVGGRFSYFAGEKRTYQTANTKDRGDFGIETLAVTGTTHLALNSSIGLKIAELNSTHSVTQYRAESDLPGYRTRRFLNFADSLIVGATHNY